MFVCWLIFYCLVLSLFVLVNVFPAYFVCLLVVLIWLFIAPFCWLFFAFVARLWIWVVTCLDCGFI